MTSIPIKNCLKNKSNTPVPKAKVSRFFFLPLALNFILLGSLNVSANPVLPDLSTAFHGGNPLPPYHFSPSNLLGIGSITIYDAEVTPLIPIGPYKGITVFRDGQPTSEAIAANHYLHRNLITPEVLQAQENVTKTQIFYLNAFGRASYDDRRSEVHVAVNVNKSMPFDIGLKENAMWMENLKLFLFGDGGGELKNFVGSLEVVAHEFTHAVVSSTSRLEYIGQSGALNEHFADVFGVMARYYFNPKIESPFLVGNHSVTEKGLQKAKSLRDMENPHQGLVWQPESVSEIPEKYGKDCKPSGTNDQCGVHILSGIPNKAVTIMISQLGWKKTGNLLYPVMTQRLSSKAQFVDYRKETLVECALQLSPKECEIVAAAFDKVGI